MPTVTEFIISPHNAIRSLWRTYNDKSLTAPELEALGVICDGDDVSVHTSRGVRSIVSSIRSARFYTDVCSPLFTYKKMGLNPNRLYPR